MEIPENPTVLDVVAAAQNCGCTAQNIRSLGNFLVFNEDEFTSDDLAELIDITYSMKEVVIDYKVAELFPDKTADTLTNEERYVLWDSFTHEELAEMLDEHVYACSYAQAFFSISEGIEGYPAFYAGMREGGYKRTITYISEHGTIPASVAFNGTITEEHLPTLTADGYVHTGWVFTYPYAGWIDQPVNVGDTFTFGPLLKAVWEEVPEEEPETTEPLSYMAYLIKPKYRKFPFWGIIGWIIERRKSGGAAQSTMVSSDGYSLTDANGLYLVPKEDE